MQSTQILSCCKLSVDRKRLCKRIKIYTGNICNIRCEFCYNKTHSGFRSFDEIKHDIDYYHKLGFTSFDFSGGEPTIIKDFPKYISYAKQFGKVSCLTNGTKFRDFNYLKLCRDLGLSEILFSVHALDKELYYKMTKGNLDHLLQAMQNAKALGILIRINVTVYDKTDLSRYADFFNDFKPFQINFIVLNYFENAVNFKRQDILNNCNKIKDCIDKLDKSIEINVRYAPFCYMQGYEKYVKDYFQHLYDLHDWSMISYSTEKYETEEQADLACAEIAKKHRLDSFYKPSQCRKCKYFFDCDGLKSKDLKPFPILKS